MRDAGTNVQPTANDEDRDLPLSGVRVVEYMTEDLASTGRYLAELGADVVLVEPLEGAASRRQGSSIDGSSLTFFARNTSKRSVALDLGTATGQQQFDLMLANADILLEGASARPSQINPIDLDSLQSRYPKLVILSVSAFARSGKYQAWHSTDAVVLAMSGMLSRSGLPDRRPLLPPGELAYECAAMQAAFVVLAAYLNRLQTGQADVLDFSVLEATAQVLDPGFGIAGSATNGVPHSELPRGRPEGRHLYPIFPCADGYVRICILSPRQWEGMFEWMGRPSEFSDPSLGKIHHRFAAADRIYPAIGALFAARSRRELVEEGQRYGVPTAAVFSLAETLEAKQFSARRVFRSHPLGDAAAIRLPDGLVEIDGVRAGSVRGAPEVGQHNGAVFAGLAGTPQPDGGDVQAATHHRHAPLRGLRVLDLGVIVVGAELGRLLADQGAEVIKIENSAFPDGGRQSLDGRPISASFAYGHRNKSSIGLDLKSQRGKELFLKLAAQSDMILSNFKPGTLESLGLGYEQVKAVNPAIIMADSSAFGPSGPWSRRLGYGPLVRASSGLTSLWRYGDDAEGFSDAVTVYPDHVAARVGAAGVLALLVRRARGGTGGTVSVAQAETILSQMAPALAAESVAAGAGAEWGAETRVDAPWGVYPCAGDDEWCVVTVQSDDQWRALCHCIGLANLAVDPEFATRAARASRKAEVGVIVAEWTKQRSPVEAAAVLQAGGVPAGPMLRVSELPGFDFYADRGTYTTFNQAHIDHALVAEGAPVHSLRLADPPMKSAPLQGEHTVTIAGTLLGLKEDEIERLIKEGVLELPRVPASDLRKSGTQPVKAGKAQAHTGV